MRISLIGQVFLYNRIAKTANSAVIGRDVLHINVKKLSKTLGVDKYLVVII